MAFSKSASEIWRDFVSSLNPLSGAWKPIKAEIRGWCAEVEAQLVALASAAGFDPSIFDSLNNRVGTFDPSVSGSLNSRLVPIEARFGIAPGKAYSYVLTDPEGFAIFALKRGTEINATARGPGTAYGDVLTDPEGFALQDNLPLLNDTDGLPLLPSFDTQVIHIINYGQSLSRGLGGVPVLTTTAPARVFRFAGGDRADDGPGSVAADHAGFVPFLAQAGPTPGSGAQDAEGETPAGGLATCFSALLAADGRSLTTQDQNLLLSSPGESGKSIIELSTGTTGFDRLTADIQYGFANSQGGGLSYGVPCFTFEQGEWDYVENTDPATYTKRWLKLRADIERLVNTTTGQRERTSCVSYQVGTHDVYGKSPVIALAQLDLVRSDDRFIMAAPMYMMEYRGDVHLTATGYKHLGAYLGKAVKALSDGVKFLPVHPIQVKRQGRILFARMHVPVAPLVLDASLITDPNGSYGFEIYDPIARANVAIGSVSIYGGEVVKIVAAADLNGACRLRYAYSPPAGFSTSASYTRNSGARGCLRDSDPTVFDPSGLNIILRNYCVIFDEGIS